MRVSVRMGCHVRSAGFVRAARNCACAVGDESGKRGGMLVRDPVRSVQNFQAIVGVYVSAGQFRS